jgi:hypothetical protein
MFTFIETKLFSRLADEYLPDDQLSRLQSYLNESPEAGDIIRESGGVRKLRWGATGRGKRAGFESFTTCDRGRARSGCLRCTPRMRRRAFLVEP